MSEDRVHASELCEVHQNCCYKLFLVLCDLTVLTRGPAQVAVAVVYCLFAAGIVFGYAALKPVLIAEGVYRERCGPSEESSRDEEVCYEQELR